MKGVSVSRIALSAAALALAALAVLAVLQRLGDNERAAGRRALLARAAELDRSALAPGSMLPCVDGTAGETVGNACEKTVFASAQSAAAAVAYMGARIDLLSEAAALARHGDAGRAGGAGLDPPRRHARPLRHRRPRAGAPRRLHRQAMRRLRHARRRRRAQGQSQGADLRPIRLPLCHRLERHGARREAGAGGCRGAGGLVRAGACSGRHRGHCACAAADPACRGRASRRPRSRSARPSLCRSRRRRPNRPRRR